MHTRPLPTKSSLMRLALVVGIGLSAIAATFQARPVTAAGCTVPATNYGTVTSSITIPSTATYRLWSRIQTPDATNNSYLLDVDNTACFTVGGGGLTAGTLSWVNYQNGSTTNTISLNLSAGTHSVKLIGSHPSVIVDRVLAVADQTCVPSGTGDNCAIIDTAAPTVTLTAPTTGATVSGSLAVTASATDDTGVSKVEFYADNQLLGADTASPYAASWDTLSTTNGSHTITAKAYDTAGNVGSDAHTVTVKNGDVEAPTAPTGLKAIAPTYNQVALTWTASTDNIGVTSYTVLRDGLSVGTATAPSFTDTGVTASTRYSYQVMAYDAAGNRSALSGVVVVTTPSVPDTQAPTTPINIVAQAVSTSQINLTWGSSSDNIGVVAYDVYRAPTGAAFTKVASVTTASLGDTGLAAGTNYSYYIVARDAAGNLSAHSATVNATTNQVATPNPTPTQTPTPVPSPSPTSTPTATPTPAPSVGAIRGRIENRRGQPIAGATITVTRNGIRYLATTNADGVYRIENIPKGTISIVIKADGYRTKTFNDTIRADRDIIRNYTLRRT